MQDQDNAYRQSLIGQSARRDDRNVHCELSVVVFASNEAARIEGCLASLKSALADWQDRCVTVIVNGSTDDTVLLARQQLQHWPQSVRLFEIPYGDKANAWNQYVHSLRPDAGWHVFVDGYLQFDDASLAALRTTLLRGQPHILAATGLPAGDHTGALHMRQAVRSHGGILGGLHALRGDFVTAIAERGLLLPIGMYRGDGLIGSFVCHALDPLNQPWDKNRVAIVDAARWHGMRLSPWSVSDIRRHLNRILKQAQGRMENRAIKHIIYREGYEGLPVCVTTLLQLANAIGPGSNETTLFRRALRSEVLRRQLHTLQPLNLSWLLPQAVFESIN